jgi:hypothetical protein
LQLVLESILTHRRSSGLKLEFVGVRDLTGQSFRILGL